MQVLHHYGLRKSFYLISLPMSDELLSFLCSNRRKEMTNRTTETTLWSFSTCQKISALFVYFDVSQNLPLKRYTSKGTF